ncbi:hypothetical protein TL16_g09933 [Triparma laevis f. inornata]|uniref:Uncharacterized protein n=1 Tax=Triparma laevis f. inornata TaxID=1714386 RepID=A0A9W7EMZ6_9STRA|nr:hypothetical protein TL16_g09933 [Triparma laevis f. inornata]
MTQAERDRLRAERGLFKSQQLSNNNWSPMMKKKISKIFNESVVTNSGGGGGGAAQLTSSPIKRIRPHTSHGRLAGRPLANTESTEGLMIAASQEQLESINLYKESIQQTVGGTGTGLEAVSRSSVEIWTPPAGNSVESFEEGSLAQPSLAGSFASSHVRLIGDGIDKAEDQIKDL